MTKRPFGYKFGDDCTNAKLVRSENEQQAITEIGTMFHRNKSLTVISETMVAKGYDLSPDAVREIIGQYFEPYALDGRPNESDSNTFPFRVRDAVIVKSSDIIWDKDGQEHVLAKGMRGTITEVCWEEWTTHVQVDFPDLGRVYVGWDVLTRADQLEEVKDHEQ